MKLLLTVLLLPLLLPALAGALCRPGHNMTKEAVLQACGPPDYAEVIHGPEATSAIPLTADAAILLAEPHTTVVWHYAPFDDQEGRIVLFRHGRVVKSCLPQRHAITATPWQLLFPPR